MEKRKNHQCIKCNKLREVSRQVFWMIQTKKIPGLCRSCAKIGIGKGHHPKTEFKKGLIPWNFGRNVIKKCLICFKDFKVPNCRIDTARFCSRNCKGKFYAGEKSCHYKKDRSLIIKKQERNDSAYKDWRISIYRRDSFKCQMDNKDCKGKIVAHHILPWISYPELRYKINNGITLCQFHHPRKRVEEVKLIQTFTGLVMQKN